MARQLTLDLPVRTALGREDFFVSPANRVAVATLDRPEGWPQGKLILVGPDGSGKSHLAAIWAATQGAATVAAGTLVEDRLPEGGPLVIEDLQGAAGNAAAERALFHLHNLALAGGRRLLMTSNAAPRALRIGLPDLASRLEGTATATLAPPDDALLIAVLVKLFADRQIAVPPALIVWLSARIDRSFAAARALVAELDARALAQGRAVTQKLAAEVLDSWRGGDQ